MRDKDGIILENLYSKILLERYYDYNPPSDKKMLMYDFYVINYLQYLLPFPSHGFRGFRELPQDIVDSVKDAANKLYPYLKKELLDAVFFSICAEWRHFSDYDENYDRLVRLYGDNENIRKFINFYDRYRKFYRKGSKEQEELTKIFGVEKPSAKERPPEIEKKEGSKDRVTSYKAVNYALEQTGMSRAFFVSLARDCYIKLRWSSSYGGDPWCGICKGWLLLDSAEGMEANKPVSQKSAPIGDEGEHEFYKQKRKEIEARQEERQNEQQQQLTIPAAIDHIYDLQHNTDTVFNKLRSYYRGGYGWIEKALTEKANVKSYYDLLRKTSGTIRALAPKVLYNKLGETWESYSKSKTPDSNSSIKKIRSGEKKCSDILTYHDTIKSKEEKKPDDGNFEMKPVGGSSKDVYITKDDLMYAVDVLGSGVTYTLKDGYFIKWRRDGDKIGIHITGPHGLVDIIYDEDPKSNTGELAKMINNLIKKDIEAWKTPNKNKSNDESPNYSSSKFDLPELNGFIQMPEDSVWKVANQYGITKDTLIAGKDQSFGGVDMGTSLQVWELNPSGEIFNKIGKPFKIPSSLKDLGNNEKLLFIKYFYKKVSEDKGEVLSQNIKPDEIKEDDVKHLLEVITMGGIAGLKNGFYMKWKEGAVPQQTTVQVWGPNGFVTSASEFNAKSKIKELTKKLNDNIKNSEEDNTFSKEKIHYLISLGGLGDGLKSGQYTIKLVGKFGKNLKSLGLEENGKIISQHDVKVNDDGTPIEGALQGVMNLIDNDIKKNEEDKKSSSKSSASNILNQGVYVTGSDIESLLKKSQNESMELKDGFHISYWKSTAVPSQKGMLQFRVFKKLKDGDFKLIYNMTDQKTGNNAVATEINNAIKEYIKENPTSKPYDPTKNPNYVPSIGFSPTNFGNEETEEPEYSTEEEEDIEDGYINVKGLKFVYYSKKLTLGNGYVAISGPKLINDEGDSYKDIEVSKDKNPVFQQPLFEDDIEDFSVLKKFAQEINKAINDDESGDMDAQHSMSDDEEENENQIFDIYDLGNIISSSQGTLYNLAGDYKAWKEYDGENINLHVVKKSPKGGLEVILMEPFNFQNAKNWTQEYKEQMVNYVNQAIKDHEQGKGFNFPTHLKQNVKLPQGNTEAPTISEKEVQDALDHVIGEEDPDFDMDIGDFTIQMQFLEDDDGVSRIEIFINKGDEAVGQYGKIDAKSFTPKHIKLLTNFFNNFMKKNQNIEESIKPLTFKKFFQESAEQDWKHLVGMKQEELIPYLQKQGMGSRDISNIVNNIKKYKDTNINPLKSKILPKPASISASQKAHIAKTKKTAQSIRQNPATMRRIQDYVQSLKQKRF